MMVAKEQLHSWVGLLRGINVGGHKKIRMQDLRDHCESIGLIDVATYVQSGNVVFESLDDKALSVATSIEDAVRDRFGFEVPVIVRSKTEFEGVATSNPFTAEPGVDEKHLCVVFLSDEPAASILQAMEVPGQTTDRFEVMGRHIYLHCPGGFARTKLTNNFFERRLGLTATARNWKTVKTLFDMLKGR